MNNTRLWYIRAYLQSHWIQFRLVYCVVYVHSRDKLAHISEYRKFVILTSKLQVPWHMFHYGQKFIGEPQKMKIILLIFLYPRVAICSLIPSACFKPLKWPLLDPVSVQVISNYLILPGPGKHQLKSIEGVVFRYEKRDLYKFFPLFDAIGNNYNISL